jgi:peptidylamidoglycolate lyase
MNAPSLRRSWPVLLLSSLPLTAVAPVEAQERPMPVCRQVEGWGPRVQPEDTLGLVAGVAMDPAGRVVAFRRAGRPFAPPGEIPITRPAVLVLDPATGAVVSSWGKDVFLVPHSITFDRDGNVWVSDTGLHQVMKFSPDGRRLMVLGEARVPGTDAAHFNQPSGVTVADDGSFYVSDGYRNTRTMHFAPDGRLLREWGAPGNGPGQFRLPHGVALGRDGLIHVADRENARMQSFDKEGRHVRTWDSVELGRPFAMLETPERSIFGGRWLVSSRSRQAGRDAPGWSRVNVVDGSGRVLGSFAEITGTGEQVLPGHGLAMGADGSVYLAGSQGLLKFACR